MMLTRGRWQTGPAIAKATARNASGGFCRKSGGRKFAPGKTPQFVARALAERGHAADDRPKACNATFASDATLRAYVVTAAILAGADGDEG